MVLLVRNAIPRSGLFEQVCDKSSLFPNVGERSPFLYRGSHSFVWRDGNLSRGWWVVWVDREVIVMHDVTECFLQFCVRFLAGCMCLVCCTGTSWQRICVGMGGWRSRGLLCL